MRIERTLSESSKERMEYKYMNIYALGNGGHTSICNDYTLDNDVSSVFAEHGSERKTQMTMACLTSGLVSPHLGHVVVDAGVMFRCDDQYTPSVRDKLYARRFFAQIKPRPARCGVSPAKPGDTVQAK
jgi:hypothetical protein